MALEVDVAPFPPYNFPCNRTGSSNPTKLYTRYGQSCQSRRLGIVYDFCELILLKAKIPHFYTFHDTDVDWGNEGGVTCSGKTGLLGKSMRSNNTFMCAFWSMIENRIRCGVEFSYPLTSPALSKVSPGIIMKRPNSFTTNSIAGPVELVNTFSFGVWLAIVSLILLTYLVYATNDKLESAWRGISRQKAFTEVIFRLISVLLDQCYFDFNNLSPSGRSIIASAMFTAFVTGNLFENGLLQTLLLRKIDEGIRDTEELISRINKEGYKLLWPNDRKDYLFAVKVRQSTHGPFYKLNQTLTENKLKRIHTTDEALDFMEVQDKYVLVAGNPFRVRFSLLLGRCNLIYRALEDIELVQSQALILPKRNQYSRQINSAIAASIIELQSIENTYYRRAMIKEKHRCPTIVPSKYEPIRLASFAKVISSMTILLLCSLVTLLLELLFRQVTTMNNLITRRKSAPKGPLINMILLSLYDG